MLVSINKTPFYRVTSKFGEMESFRSKPHSGVDLKMDVGEDVLSPTDGVVEDIVNYGDENIGLGVKIRTEDDETLILGHLDSVNVEEGDFVWVGRKIAESGNTGNTTGPHLHIGLKDEEGFTDPQDYVDIFQNLSRNHVLSNADGHAPPLFDDVKEFIIDKLIASTGITLDILKMIGFDLSFGLNVLFFLIPALLCIYGRFWLQIKFVGRWILPLLYAYFVIAVLQ